MRPAGRQTRAIQPAVWVVWWWRWGRGTVVYPPQAAGERTASTARPSAPPAPAVGYPLAARLADRAAQALAEQETGLNPPRPDLPQPRLHALAVLRIRGTATARPMNRPRVGRSRRGVPGQPAPSWSGVKGG